MPDKNDNTTLIMGVGGLVALAGGLLAFPAFGLLAALAIGVIGILAVGILGALISGDGAAGIVKSFSQ